MTPGTALLRRLAARQPAPQRVIILAAHPDDETIGLGAQLCRFQDALLVHVTDGAPRSGRDAEAYGFISLTDYAAARRAELTAALAAGRASHLRTLCLGIVDQEAVHHLVYLAERLRRLFEADRPRVVITHSYEGGHPDHDATAFAVHAACRLMADPPVILEMALYHRRAGQLVCGEFVAPALPQNAGPAAHFVEPLTTSSRSLDCRAVLALDEEEIRRKQAMIDCFATQRWLLMQLAWNLERLRIAPHYDFRAAPHSGELHYETLGWCVTGSDWRRYAEAALAELKWL